MISAFFIDRPKFAFVIAIVTTLVGLLALMVLPIAQFPGERNWGYDGAYPFAAQASYGGHAGFKRLVDAAHAAGLAVILDVVYNHLGPEGNYLADFGPYFTDRYRTPWGSAVNFDGPQSDHVRAYFAENARAWLEDTHVDGLRLDVLCHRVVQRRRNQQLRSILAFVKILGNIIVELATGHDFAGNRCAWFLVA